jgi:TPP-dependent pyruvate/acetoin dehydrogenase alpha subunit
MPRLDGDVFLLGTAISAPVPFQIQNNTYAISQFASAGKQRQNHQPKSPKHSGERRV